MGRLRRALRTHPRGVRPGSRRYPDSSPTGDRPMSCIIVPWQRRAHREHRVWPRFSMTFGILWLTILAARVHAQTGNEPCAIAIVGATLIDGNGGVPVANATVLVRDQKFDAIGRREAVA